jgi:hypothetical protein
MQREFALVPLPARHVYTPLVDGCDEQLAAMIVGVQVFLRDIDDIDEDPPLRCREILGRITDAQPAGTHILATVSMNMEALGAERIVECLERGDLRFGLWGVGLFEGDAIRKITPTSVRIEPIR